METVVMLLLDPRLPLVLAPVIVSIYSSLALLEIIDRQM